MLADKTDFSIDNGLIDEHGTYVIFDREIIMRILNISKNTATKVIKELESYGLILTIQNFIGESKRIYIYIPNELLHKTNKEAIISQEGNHPKIGEVNPKCTCHQAQNLDTNNTLLINTLLSNHHQDYSPNKQKEMKITEQLKSQYYYKKLNYAL